ncbi:TetR/AcrR family transcriptional regulator [Pseudokordiimonas caeni]|uniref:TetR/AcrR family transcriptional regulator n=1 Tax=Pseudokordiimonas caeni TaxID=2997908 RepID=UPI002811EFA2|nr:TetR/AcrR family transcriptional regulator [Pseudokordiimonas caeni]
MTTRPAIRKEPRQARAKARVKSLIEATERLLVATPEAETAALSTTAIAREAGVPVGSVYQYFESLDSILEVLRERAHDEVMQVVADELQRIGEHSDWSVTNRHLIKSFWATARAHPTFCRLTRYENSTQPLWNTIPGPGSWLDRLIREALAKTDRTPPADRLEAQVRTLTAAISVLTDQAIEEQDEARAEVLVDEMIRLVAGYLA